MSRFVKAIFLPLLAAILLSVSRLPLHLGWLVFFAFIPLLTYIDSTKRTQKELLLSSAVFALVQIAVVFYWIGSVTWGGLVGIWLLYALYYYLSFMVINRIWHALPHWRNLGFIFVMLAFEYLQNFGEMRFPWFNISYALADYLVLIQAADLGGMSLLSILILVVNTILYQIWKQSDFGKLRLLFKGSNQLSWMALILLFSLWISYGIYCFRYIELQESPQKIAVMQPSIPQEEKWEDSQLTQIKQVYHDLVKQASQDSISMIVFPEAAMPVYLMLDLRELTDFKRMIQGSGLSAFTGFPHSSYADEGYPQPYYYYNAASLFHPDGGVDAVYYKNILVPVGERMLWLDTFPFLWGLQLGQANWEFGTQIPWYHQDQKHFSPSICYELAFPHFMLKANFKPENGKIRKADYHVNITNDAWFGTSYGPWLHMVMTRFRSVESRIQIYRSANTGISVITDPMGRILARADLFEKKNITAALYTTKQIPIYPHIQYYPWALILISLVLYGYSFISKRSQQ